jgi:hypothetical protein
MLTKAIETPIFVHPGMEKILIDRCQFMLKLTVQPLNNG